MIGSRIELKWNNKDLQSLEQVLTRVKGRTAVVQAGGCLGVFASRLAREFKAVYTFEPDPGLFTKMCRNIGNLSNVVKIQAALGCDRNLVRTECSLRPNDGKTSVHEGMTRTEPKGIVPTLTIDDLNLPICDLIYLDVEGDEIFALTGASQTIERCRPIIACEVNRGVVYRGFKQEDVGLSLRARGYEFVAKHRSDEVYAPVG